MGPSTGSRKVRSRLKTCVRKIPIGLVTASMSARKNRICSQPFTVIFRTFPDAIARMPDKRGAMPRLLSSQEFQDSSHPLLQLLTRAHIGERDKKKANCQSDK